MSAQTGETPAANGRLRRLTPEEVRRHAFTRAPLSRRGLDDEEVAEFLATVADQVVAMETEIEQVNDENRRLKHAMREWHRQQVGYDSAELMARTQQEIEEQIARAESYSREREEEAARRYEAIVAEAYQRAEEAVASRGRQATGEYPVDEPASSPASGAAEAPEAAPADGGLDAAGQLQVDGLLRALDGLAAHIDAARSLFAQEAGAGTGGGDEADDSQGRLFPSGDDGGQGANGAGRPVDDPGNGAGVPGRGAGPDVAEPGGFGGFGEPQWGEPQDDVHPTPPGPWVPGEAGEAPGRYGPQRARDVERQDGFEARRPPVPRPPVPPPPPRRSPAEAPPETGPDTPPE